MHCASPGLVSGISVKAMSPGPYPKAIALPPWDFPEQRCLIHASEERCQPLTRCGIPRIPGGPHEEWGWIKVHPLVRAMYIFDASTFQGDFCRRVDCR